MRNILILIIATLIINPITTSGQLGKRFPSERKIISDPVSGTPLIFLTSQPWGDAKIYHKHPQWTSDGEWVVFRSNRQSHKIVNRHSLITTTM